MDTQLTVNLPAQKSYSYPILIGTNLLNDWQQWLNNYSTSNQIVIISDDIVANLYGNRFCKSLNEAGFTASIFQFPHGESSKTSTTKAQLEEQLFQKKYDRHILCLALGGGVVGDLAGYIASTYMRGIDYVQIPTSLLAMVDSSVGGKTAINNNYGKNLVGTFYQPKAVIMDLNLLDSLPNTHIISGLFEVIKIFLTYDQEYYHLFKDNLQNILNLDKKILIKIIKRAVSIKAFIVSIDEHEENLRMILNFGHTVGHAIEKLTNYTLLHGYAVGLGMLVEAKIAQLLGYLSKDDYNEVANILTRLEIKSSMIKDYSINNLLINMRSDKKNKDNQINMVLLTKIGEVQHIDNVVAFTVEENIIIKAIQILKESD